MDSPDQYLDGSPVDRLIIFGLLAAALAVIISRGERSAELLKRNAPLLLFLFYCVATSLWSDYPFVTFKRWTKTLGNVAIVFVILTDPYPRAALSRLLARLSFLLIGVSILLIKYFPQLGRGYDRWVGTPMYTGVTDNKNSLGCICLVCGLGSLWLCLDALRDKPERLKRLFVHGTMLAATLWLFLIVNSATSLACFIVGSGLIVVLSRSRQGRPATVHFIIGTAVVSTVFAFMFLNAQAHLLNAMGRDATLTGRTELWETLLQMDRSPWFGAGFESFFLGDRAKYLWSKYWWHPNEAHSGYLEVYLTLGLVGAGLLIVLIVSGYRNVVNAYREDPASGTIRLAFWIAAIAYNGTEAGVKVMHPVWIAFLLAVTATLPKRTSENTAREHLPAAVPIAGRPGVRTWRQPPRRLVLKNRSWPAAINDNLNER
jgi:exopolysaccharide production protein ExoQ